jgi:hypothetical protein
LWYTGVAANQGWIVMVEDLTLVRLNSPLWSGHGTFNYGSPRTAVVSF